MLALPRRIIVFVFVFLVLILVPVFLDGLRSGVIEAAQAVAEKEGFDDDWEIEVELNVDDGRTINAVVVKKPDGEPQITAWEAKASGEATSRWQRC